MAPSAASDALRPLRNAARLVTEETLARTPGEPPTLAIHSSSYGLPAGNTKGYASTYLAMGFANVRAGTWYPPDH